MSSTIIFLLQFALLFPISLTYNHHNKVLLQKCLKLGTSVQPFETTTKTGEKNIWVPIGLKSALNSKLPNEVIIADEKYVVWNSESNWFVQRDACSHRLAPLSQGRIDKTTGCIECPYHGWQFDGEGHCKKIPQLDNSNQIIPAASKIKSFQVHTTGDLIWASLPLGEGLVSTIDLLPDQLFPVLNNASFVSRELPYSADFLIENFMDPAHIPFAHHGAQALRSDGSSLPMTALTSISNSTHCQIQFQDIIRGKKREGVVSYISPNIYTTTKINNDGSETFFLLAIVAPVLPGLSPGRKLPLPIPNWFIHSIVNGFLDMDLWLHDQERTVRKNSKASELNQYVLPTKSDFGVRYFRNWWNLHMSNSPYYGKNYNKNLLTNYARKDQLNRYDTHIKHCQSCYNFLQKINKSLTILPIISLILLIFLEKKLHKFLALGISSSIFYVLNWIKKKILGPTEDEITSAAQF